MLENLQSINILNLSVILRKYIFRSKIKNLYIEICTIPKYVKILLIFFKYNTVFLTDCFIDISVIDCPKFLKRFSITYNMLSIFLNSRCFVKIKSSEVCKNFTISNFFSGVN